MSAGERVRYRVRYRGNVQGVGFRMTSVAQARGLAVHGFVRNEPDGSVLMDVEGPQRDVKALLDRIDLAMRDNIDDTQLDSLPIRGIGTGFRVNY